MLMVQGPPPPTPTPPPTLRNTALELLSTYKILVAFHSYTGELGMLLSRKLKGFLKVPLVPMGWVWVLSSVGMVICLGQWVHR